MVAKRKWKAYHGYLSMAEISEMSGLEFEQLLARLLQRLSYSDIQLTPINDQGGDIICTSRKGVRTVVQAKRWKSRIGNKAVQEVLAAMLHYDCQAALVITNSTFTRSAIELAAKDLRIRLHDYHWLEPMMREHFPIEIPEFSWDQYNAIVVPKLVEIASKPTRVSDVKKQPFGYKRRCKRYWR